MVRFRALMFWPLSIACFLAGAQQGGDLQAQILYAFHVENTGQLAGLIQTLSTQVQAGQADNALRYHLAHAEYRFGLLTGEKSAHDAASAFSVCVDQLKPLLEQDPNSVESLVLQSACYADLADLKRLEA